MRTALLLTLLLIISCKKDEPAPPDPVYSISIKVTADKLDMWNTTPQFLLTTWVLQPGEDVGEIENIYFSAGDTIEKDLVGFNDCVIVLSREASDSDHYHIEITGYVTTIIDTIVGAYEYQFTP